MIISCPNCNKKFNIDQKLIPETGRLLQCSSCNHKWHYTITKVNNELTIKEKIQNQDSKNKILNPALNKEASVNKVIKKIDKKNIEKRSIKKEIYNKNKKSNIKFDFSNVLKKLMIIIITFFALILILDTFKMNISNYVPVLIPFLDNLYQSIIDLISFLKDLVK